MSEALFKLLTGIGGLSGVAALVICWMAYRLITSEKEARTKETEERKNLKEKVDIFEKERFARLEKKVEDHVSADKADVILNELKNISGTQNSQNAIITAMSGEVRQLLVNDGKQGEKLDSLDRYIKGVDASLREHKNNHPGATKK